MVLAQQVASLVAGIVAVLAAVFSVVAVIVLLKSKTDTLERAEVSIKADIKQVRDSINTLTVLFKVSAAEQKIMHKMNTVALEGITNRVDKLEEEVKKWH